MLQEANRRTEELRSLRDQLPAATAPLLFDPSRTAPLGELPDAEAQIARVLRGDAGSLADLAERLPLDELTLGRAVIALRDRSLLVAGARQTGTDIRTSTTRRTA